MAKAKRAFVICPGRGSYTKECLGYLNSANHSRDFVRQLDLFRQKNQEPSISDMDQAESFKANIHTKGEHASALIYACAYSDFLAIDQEKFEIVAVAGNSMGWYISLAVAQAVSTENAFQIINGMGSMMKNELIGGQVIYPVVDENWIRQKSRESELRQLTTQINEQKDSELYLSIDLGGYWVWGGNQNGLNSLLKKLPPIENYPFQLINHGAFHTPMLKKISERALTEMQSEWFQRPKFPLIDGQGNVWTPWSTDPKKLFNYTFDHQVIAPYDFTQSIIVGLKEYAPDVIILLGPGSNLGGSIAQSMISINWKNLEKKSDFVHRQEHDPLLYSMGRPEQRSHIV